MKWKDRAQSSNVVDRRGIPVGAGMGIGGTLLVLLIGYFTGIDVTPLVDMASQPSSAPAPGEPGGGVNTMDDEQEAFVATILRDTEDVWTAEFRRQLKQDYQPPSLVLFTDRVSSGCGVADSSIGPFYCPLDQQVYLDTVFYQQLDQQLGAPGDFAQAYVIAHEIGHHIQQITGVSDQVRSLQEGARSEAERNEYSVRLELQADYLAGAWAHHAQKNWSFLEPGDVDEALNAASAIGDDRLQQQATGTVRPDTFTHGTSAQRAKWFRMGLESGQIDMENTFRGGI